MTQARQLSVSGAANASGRSKSSILRAIRSGALSASRNDAGGFVIDPAELSRAFPAAHQPAPNGLSWRGADAQLEARLGDALDQVADLRRRLDESERERREQAARIVALLTDQRPARRRRWWRRG